MESTISSNTTEVFTLDEITIATSAEQSSLPPPSPFTVAYFAEVTTLCIAICLIIVGNVATISAFWKVPSLREKPSDLLILSLSCADLGIGLNLFMIIPSVIADRWIWGKLGCQISVFVLNVFVVAGVFTTLSISADRYLLISRAYPKYIRLQSRRRVIFNILAIWSYSLAIGIAEIILWDVVVVPGVGDEGLDYANVCKSPPKHSFLSAAIYFVINIFSPLIAIEVLSLAFVAKLRKKLTRTANVGDSTSTQVSQNDSSVQGNGSGTSGQQGLVGSSSKNRYVKAAVTLGALVIVLNICLLPYVLYSLIISLFCKGCNNQSVRVVLMHIVRFNSFMNPLMYAVTMSKIRMFYRKSIFRKRCY